MKFYNDPVYIGMCRKAEEIQALAEYKSGDWYIHMYEYQERYNVGADPIGDDDNITSGVWIPRLDQLIEMAMGSGTIQATHNEFQQYEWENPGYKTYEEEWLGFVMEKLHGKRWTGEEWEEI